MLHGFAKLENEARRRGILRAGWKRFRRLDQPASAAPRSASGDKGSEMEAALMGTELFASVIVGGLLGWFIGQLFGISSPWPLLIGLTIGAIAGFREVYRYIVREMDRERTGQGDR